MRPSLPRSSSPSAALAAALVLAAALAVPASPAGAAAGAVDPDLLAGMAARSIGPATMSGRIAAIDAVPGDPPTIWVGAATGGVWRSIDGGLNFEPVFDDQPVAAIGAIAVEPRRPDVVWVGTGEGNPRNSASVGNGVYRSLDGGATWAHLGLEETERVHRILLHPNHQDTAWVCAMGKTWGENAERGVFRTDDGGATWKHVLAVDERTGCADLAADPRNPAKLYAAMWDHRRWPWSFRSGGPGSGLFVSHDGGESWRRVTPEDGFPEGDLGRIGVAVAASSPDVVYALVEGEEATGLYRSTDGGRTWTLRTTDPDAGNRPFYYADLRVDPADADRVYSLWSLVSVSDDGGERWEVLVPFRGVHPDHHALWIDPGDPRHLFNGNDGGVYESRDHGRTWRFVANLPLAQYYHVRVDDETPYNVYGGLQDNGSWRGPSEVRENGGIRNHHWQEVGFGDGFDTVPIPGDSRRGYAMSQEGHVHRWDLDTGERRSIRPAPAGDEPLRFNWNAAIEVDPFDPDTVYFGSQFVHRSRDRGETWETISPDLTTDRADWQRQDESGGLTLDVTGAENFTTLVALAASPVERGVLWAGSDDGRLHVTRDGGATWTSVEAGMRAGSRNTVPEHTWIPHVEPSPHDAGTAFVVLDNHRRSDWTPYVFRTTDFGRTWKSLATPALRGYALSIRQDPVDPDLLFVGTEFGLWVSLDGGASWLPFRHGLPTVSVMDLAIQPRESDLVIATHGRSLYVVDDLTPLRHLEPEHLAAPIHLYPIADAEQAEIAQTGSSRFPGDVEFRGENEPYGALIAFTLAGDELPWPDEERERARKAAARDERRREAERRPALEREEGAESVARRAPQAGPEAGEEAGEAEAEAGEAADEKKGGPKAEIVVRDAAGRRIRRFETPVHRGLNRVAWNLRRDDFAEPKTEDDEDEGFDTGGAQVVPGVYQVTVRYGEAAATAPVRVLGDARFALADGERRAAHEAVLRVGALQETLTAAIDRVRGAQRDVETVLARHAEAEKRAEEEAERDGTAETQAAETEAAETGASAAAPAADDDASDALARDGRKLLADLAALERDLWVPPDTRGIPPEHDAWSKVGRAGWLLGDAWRAPTPAQRRYVELAEQAVAQAVEDVNRFFAERVAPFRERAAAHLRLLAEEEPLEMP